MISVVSYQLHLQQWKAVDVRPTIRKESVDIDIFTFTFVSPLIHVV